MSLKMLLIAVTYFAVSMACYGWWLRIPEPFKDDAGFLCWFIGWMWTFTVPILALLKWTITTTPPNRRLRQRVEQ